MRKRIKNIMVFSSSFIFVTLSSLSYSPSADLFSEPALNCVITLMTLEETHFLTNPVIIFGSILSSSKATPSSNHTSETQPHTPSFAKYISFPFKGDVIYGKIIIVYLSDNFRPVFEIEFLNREKNKSYFLISVS